MSYRIVPCPKCNRLHGVVAVRSTRRAITPVVAPDRPGREDPSPVRGTTPETPRDGRNVLAVGTPSDDPALRSSQAASQLPLVFRGSTG